MPRRIIQAVVAAMAATLVVAVASSSAARLEIPNFEGGFKIVWPSLTVEAAEIAVSCPVTLEGSFETRTTEKRAGRRIAAITAESLGPCTTGQMVLLPETLPWSVTYRSFTGTLPTITSISLDIIGLRFFIRNIVTCLAATEVMRPASLIASVGSGTITAVRASETAGITTTGGFFCTLAGAAHFSGTASSVTNKAGNAAIGLHLF